MDKSKLIMTRLREVRGLLSVIAEAQAKSILPGGESPSEVVTRVVLPNLFEEVLSLALLAMADGLIAEIEVKRSKRCPDRKLQFHDLQFEYEQRIGVHRWFVDRRKKEVKEITGVAYAVEAMRSPAQAAANTEAAFLGSGLQRSRRAVALIDFLIHDIESHAHRTDEEKKTPLKKVKVRDFVTSFIVDLPRRGINDASIRDIKAMISDETGGEQDPSVSTISNCPAWKAYFAAQKSDRTLNEDEGVVFDNDGAMSG